MPSSRLACISGPFGKCDRLFSSNKKNICPFEGLSCKKPLDKSNFWLYLRSRFRECSGYSVVRLTRPASGGKIAGIGQVLKMFQVYILRSRSLQQHYVGQTNDLEDRLTRHNAGRSPSTKRGIPWLLVWNKEFQTRSEAVRLERQIKSRGIKRWLGDHGLST